MQNLISILKKLNSFKKSNLDANIKNKINKRIERGYIQPKQNKLNPSTDARSPIKLNPVPQGKQMPRGQNKVSGSEV